METATKKGHGIMEELAFSLALNGIAEGGSVNEVRGTMRRCYGRYVNYSRLEEIMTEAKREAIAQGVEREDMDNSWFAKDCTCGAGFRDDNCAEHGEEARA